jgi:hypothetical protein
VISHRPLGLSDFDRLLALRDGRLVEIGASQAGAIAPARTAAALPPSAAAPSPGARPLLAGVGARRRVASLWEGSR